MACNVVMPAEGGEAQGGEAPAGRLSVPGEGGQAQGGQAGVAGRAPAFVSATALAWTAAATLTLTLPGPPAPGETATVILVSQSGAAWAAPSGWSAVSVGVAPVTGWSFLVMTRVTAGGDPPEVTVPSPAPGLSAATAAVVGGAGAIIGTLGASGAGTAVSEHDLSMVPADSALTWALFLAAARGVSGASLAAAGLSLAAGDVAGDTQFLWEAEGLAAGDPGPASATLSAGTDWLALETGYNA